MNSSGSTCNEQTWNAMSQHWIAELKKLCLGKTDQEQCLQKASIKESGSICAIRTGFCKETMRNNGKQIRK